jgi:hypothetical protein
MNDLKIVCNVGEAKSAIKDIVSNTNISVALWGPPGCGKSDIIRQVASELDWQFHDIRCAHFDPIELKGVPVARKGEDNKEYTTWLIPDFWPTEGPGIIFLDEFTNSPPAVQNVMLQLTLDRELHGYKVPDNVKIVLAGNKAEHGAFVSNLSLPAANRMLHYAVEPMWADTRSYWKTLEGTDQEVIPQIISFLDHKTELLFDMELAKKSQDDLAFPTPRSWHMLSKILKGVGNARSLSQTEVENFAIACIGKGAGVEFAGFLETYTKIDCENIFENGNMPVFTSNDVALMWAATGATSYFFTNRLGTKERRLEEKHVKNFIAFLNLLPVEYKVKTMKNVEWRKHPNHLKACRKFAPSEFDVLAEEVRELLL